MIYFAQPAAGGPVKIGYSADVPARVRALESYYGRPLAVLATLPGDPDTEAEVHARFAHLRFGKTEQFRPAPELMAFINRPLFVNQGDVELMQPAPGRRPLLLTFTGCAEFDAWLGRLAAVARLPRSVLIEHALIAYAKALGFDEEAPER